MKKRGIIFTAVFMAAALFISCSDASEDDGLYSVEIGTVTNATYEQSLSMIESYGSSINRSSIKEVRKYLYENTVSDYSGGIKAEESEITSLLRQKGFSASAAENEINALNSIGNDILFFESAKSSNHKVWMYVEK